MKALAKAGGVGSILLKEYRIERVLNNNVLIVHDEGEIEKILVGRGIGFAVKPGNYIDSKDMRIEKRFTLVLDENRNHFQHIFILLRMLKDCLRPYELLMPLQWLLRRSREPWEPNFLNTN